MGIGYYFAGIVVSMPDQTQLQVISGFDCRDPLLICRVVYITEAERLLTYTHTEQARAGGYGFIKFLSSTPL